MATVSVVVPTYNRADVLPETIDSVRRQTIDDWELLVVDDASSDQTEDVMMSYEDPRIRYFQHDENQGGSAARNTGIEHATGEYVAFLDDDDEWESEKLERQLDCLRPRSDEWIGVHCGIGTPRADGLRAQVKRLVRAQFDTTPPEGDEELIRRLLLLDVDIGAGSTLLAERSAVEAIDGFDESFDRHQDWEFLIRLLRVGKIAYVDEQLVVYDGQTTTAAAELAATKQQFLDKFADEVERLERQGDDVTRAHELSLANVSFRQGELRRGWSYLRGKPVNRPRLYLSAGLGAAAGVRRRIATALNDQ
jgi:glycosyltransferase involved in cell wall biosynthesis